MIRSVVCRAIAKASPATTQIDPALFPLVLYKRILRLHYGLPAPARLLGDVYVRDEFRRHMDVSPELALVFLREWTQYSTMLSKQLTGRGIARGELGKDINPEDLDKFQDEQLRQLLELKEQSESAKAVIQGELFPDNREKTAS